MHSAERKDVSDQEYWDGMDRKRWAISHSAERKDVSVIRIIGGRMDR